MIGILIYVEYMNYYLPICFIVQFPSNRNLESQVFFSCHEAKQRVFGSQNTCRINNTTFKLRSSNIVMSGKEEKTTRRGMCNEFFFLKPNEFKVK